jgi:ribosomal protein RSM22 (predicted rRNA methylase)
MQALAHLDAFLERAHPGFADDKGLLDEARALSEAYTTGAAIPQNAAGSLAYLAHFGPRAVVAVSHALSFVDVPASCVDVGAGSGASALALFAAGAKHVTLVEASGPALALAKRLLEGVGDVRTSVARLEDAAADTHGELLLSAFTFGELPSSPVESFQALRRIAPKSTRTVLVDAGDHARARRIQELRDHLVHDDKLAILAPCPHRDACPALVRARDWCHTRIDKALPERLARFARNVGRDDEKMAASLLVCAHGARAAPADGIVVIGEPVVDKGRVRIPVCGPAGLRFVQALKRHREMHDLLREMPRGTRLPSAVMASLKDNTAHVADVLEVVSSDVDAKKPWE